MNSTRERLRISNDPMYQLLREGCITEFNAKKAAGEKADLKGCDLRGLDLRGLEADGLDFSGSYFRQTDLRGIDFRKALPRGSQHQCRQDFWSLFSGRIIGRRN